MSSTKPTKQRKSMYQAALHIKHKMLSAHLSKPLRTQWNRRSLTLRKGDEVKVMRGSHAGKTGKITGIDMKALRVFIDSMKRRKVAGQEASIPFKPSKLMIINPVMEDKMRKRIIERSMKKVQ